MDNKHDLLVNKPEPLYWENTDIKYVEETISMHQRMFIKMKYFIKEQASNIDNKDYEVLKFFTAATSDRNNMFSWWNKEERERKEFTKNLREDIDRIKECKIGADLICKKEQLLDSCRSCIIKDFCMSSVGLGVR